MKYLFYIILVIATSLTTSLYATPPAVEAQAIYTCPAGQIQGRGEMGQDVRYCYIEKCPVGELGNPIDASGGNDTSKCYKYEVVNGAMKATEVGEAIRDRINISNSDNMKCPDGSYRGGIKSGQDANKCYTCDINGCQDVNQSVVPEHYEACLNSNRSCHRVQERAQERYMQSIRDAAPRGFTIPNNRVVIGGSSTAIKFCQYYSNMDWQTNYGTRYTSRACIIGYEVGFGGGMICSKEYLFGHDATHRSAPTSHAEGFRQYAKSLPKTQRNLLMSDAIKACQDGWMQYSVDYWYCEGNKACEDRLRTDKTRVINPGPRPSKTSYVNENGERVEMYNTVTTSQSCGSVQTAYFTCGFGDGVENSTLWQLLQIVLNILLALVGIAAVGGLVYGAVRYSSAGDNTSQVEQAKTIIKNVIIGIVLFLVMWAFIQYMIPGGIFTPS